MSPSRRALAALLLICGIFLSGCSTVKGWLRPWVCADGACECKCEKTELAAQTIDAPEETSGDGEDEANHPTEERVKRPKTDPYKLVDASDAGSRQDLTSAETITILKESFSGKSDTFAKENQAVRGRFTKRGTDELAIISPESEISIYNSRGRVAYRDKDRPLASAEGLPYGPVLGMRLVRDGRLELLLITQEQTNETTNIYFSIYKVFGREIGRVFDAKIGEAHDGKFVPFARVQTMEGDRDHFLELTPVKEGTPVETDRQIFHWNHWEGMYRVPRQAPTAPATKNGV